MIANHDERATLDILHSEASRLAEWVLGEQGVPYEAFVAAVAVRDAAAEWTRLMARSARLREELGREAELVSRVLAKSRGLCPRCSAADGSEGCDGRHEDDDGNPDCPLLYPHLYLTEEEQR